MQGLGKAPERRASPGASFPLPFLTSWVITRCRGRFSFQDISDYELVIEAVYLSWHARFVGHSPPSWSCVPIVWSRSGLMIHKHSDHGTSKEPMNPCQEWVYWYLSCTMTLSSLWRPASRTALEALFPGEPQSSLSLQFSDISLKPTKLQIFYLFVKHIIVYRGEWSWNSTKFFVVCFCSLFWTWPRTKHNSCLLLTEELTNRNVLIT